MYDKMLAVVFGQSIPICYLLAMKLTILLTFLITINVSAYTYGQQIDLHVKDASLESVLKNVQKQSGYNFLFNNDYLKTANRVTLTIRNMDIVDALPLIRSEEHTSELQSLMRISYAVFCLKKKTIH